MYSYCIFPFHFTLKFIYFSNLTLYNIISLYNLIIDYIDPLQNKDISILYIFDDYALELMKTPNSKSQKKKSKKKNNTEMSVL